MSSRTSSFPSHRQRLILEQQIQRHQTIAANLELAGEQADFFREVDTLREVCQFLGYLDAASRLEELARLIRTSPSFLNVGLYYLWKHLLNEMQNQVNARDQRPREWGWAIGLPGHWGGWRGWNGSKLSPRVDN